MHRQRACALSRFIIKARFLIEMKLYQEYLNYLSDLIFPGICPVCEKAPYQGWTFLHVFRMRGFIGLDYQKWL